MSLEIAFVHVFFILTLSTGVWCVVSPESVIRFRRRLGWSESMVTGGYFYATKRRTRIVGGLVAVASAFCLYLALT